MKGGALFLLLFLLLQPVRAYDQHSTHPSLTYEMAQFFNGKNLNLNHYLLPKEIAWLKQGSVEEDEPARWINHFYDPVHNVGWSGKHLGGLSQEEGYKLGGDIAPRHSIASVDWVTNQDYQAAYGRQYGNQTWQKAIKSYLDGDKQSAFIALGHVLHLVEDATVPDHVRDDSHPGIEGDPGSPYEVYSKVQTDAGELNMAEDLLQNNKDFKKLISINQTIKDVAIYTNKNFFSEDTINNSEFNSPYVIGLERKQVGGSVYFFDKSLDAYLARLNINNGLDGSEKFSTNDYKFVLPSYRDHLFPEAVLTGASVINLFFQEVEKYKQNPNDLERIVPDSNDSFLVALQQFPKRTVLKVCGSISEALCKDAGNTLLNTVATIKNAPQTLASTFSATVGGLLDFTKQKLGFVSNQTVSQSNSDASQNVGGFNPTQLPNSEPVKISQVSSVVQNTSENKTNTHTTLPSNSAVLGVKITNPVINQNPSIIIPVLGHLPTQAIYGGGAQGVNFYKPGTIFSGPIVSQEPVASVSSSPVLGPPPINNALTSSPEIIPTSTPSINPVVTSTTSSVPLVIDTTPPSVPILDITNQSGIGSVNILINMASGAELSLPIYFSLQVSTNTTNWEDIATSTVNRSFNFAGTRGQSYYFRARAADALGNISAWSAVSLPVFVNWSSEVVINEVAWAGTSVDFSTNEWFELYNNSSQSVDIKDWKILISNKILNWSKVNTTTIPAHTYYLFERTSDNTVKEIAADALFSGSLSNSGEKLELIKPDGEKADEVNAASGWFAGDSIKYKSMERINPLASGSDVSNWQSNQGFRENGRTFNGGQIYGSPRRSNFGFINLNFDQEDSIRTLTKNNNPYILQYYAIPAGKKLLIEPGVVIKSYFNNSKIDVLGTLSAIGESNNKIIFTSGRDVSLESATANAVVGSWPSPSSSAQDWQGIWFKPGSTGILSNISFRYAGKGFVVPPFALPVSQAIRADGASLAITDSLFSDNGPLALFAKDSTTTIVNTTMTNGDRAVQSENSLLSISNSTFANFSNFNGPLYIKDKWPLLNNITYTTNALNMPYLEAVTISQDQAVIKESENYLVNILTVGPSSTLTIEPGASVYLPLYGIFEVKGVLHALGTADKYINFLPYPASANWGNIRFTKSTSTLGYVNFKQGNRLNGRPENLNGMILATDSTITLTNSNLWDSEANFIQSNNSTIKVSNTTIGATIKNINTKGIKAPTGVVSLDNVNFSNLSIGLESGSSGASQLIVDVKNMSSSSFSNVDYFWQPLNLWSFPPIAPIP